MVIRIAEPEGPTEQICRAGEGAGMQREMGLCSNTSNLLKIVIVADAADQPGRKTTQVKQG